MTNLAKYESGAPDIGREVSAKNILFDYIRQPEYKRLLSQVVHAQDKEKFKSIAVISEYPGEGKSFFVSALALGYASFLRRRVLIMDTVSQTRNESLFADRLIGQGDFGTDEAGAGTIDLITSGGLRSQIQEHCEPLDPILAISGGYDTADFQIGPFIEMIERTYDLILLDTCAMRGTTKNHFDPIILAKQADTSILVTSRISLEQRTVRKIDAKLKWSHVELLGTIFNSGATNG